MKKAFITGITGQDGSYLAEFLLSKGYEVHGFIRRTSNDPLERLSSFNKTIEGINLIYGNLQDMHSIERALQIAKPDEIYNLAAQSHVGVSFMVPGETMEVNYYGVGRLVDAALQLKSVPKIYQASTSEMFGKTPPPQNEQSPFRPVSPYAIAKMKAHEEFVVGYRERYKLFICSGILFNHESPRRGHNFVTRKITTSLVKMKLGLQEVLELGNLDAKRDWGYAGDYVKAMWTMLQQDTAEDYVIATGVAHTVRDFVNAAAQALGMRFSWKGTGVDEVGKDRSGRIRVRVNPQFYRPQEVNDILGDSTKAKEKFGWKPEVSFDELVQMMVKADLSKVQKAADREKSLQSIL